jgi:exosortase
MTMLGTIMQTANGSSGVQERIRAFSWPILLPIALLLVVYFPALSELVQDWWGDDNYSHGFLVPVVSGYLLWQKRELLAGLSRRTDFWGLAVIIAGLSLFVVANAAAEYFTLRVSFVMALFGIVWYFYGREIMKHTWFEFFFLLFMIPIPYVIYYGATFPMQTLATKITVWILEVLGTGAYRIGNVIRISGHSLEVAEACSGVRSLVSLMALGAFYAHTTQKQFLPKTILFLSTIPIAVAGNVFRVATTAILVHAVTPDVLVDPWHSLMGLLVFVVAFVSLFIESAILRRIFK